MWISSCLIGCGPCATFTMLVTGSVEGREHRHRSLVQDSSGFVATNSNACLIRGGHLYKKYPGSRLLSFWDEFIDIIGYISIKYIALECVQSWSNTLITAITTVAAPLVLVLAWGVSYGTINFKFDILYIFFRYRWSCHPKFAQSRWTFEVMQCWACVVLRWGNWHAWNRCCRLLRDYIVDCRGQCMNMHCAAHECRMSMLSIFNLHWLAWWNMVNVHDAVRSPSSSSGLANCCTSTLTSTIP